MVAQCGSCGGLGDPKMTAHSLIGRGWRLMRVSPVDGPIRAEWRCPECWAAFRKARDAKIAAANRSGRLIPIPSPRKPSLRPPVRTSQRPSARTSRRPTSPSKAPRAKAS